MTCLTLTKCNNSLLWKEKKVSHRERKRVRERHFNKKENNKQQEKEKNRESEERDSYKNSYVSNLGHHFQTEIPTGHKLPRELAVYSIYIMHMHLIMWASAG